MYLDGLDNLICYIMEHATSWIVRTKETRSYEVECDICCYNNYYSVLFEAFPVENGVRKRFVRQFCVMWFRGYKHHVRRVKRPWSALGRSGWNIGLQLWPTVEVVYIHSLPQTFHEKVAGRKRIIDAIKQIGIDSSTVQKLLQEH